MVGACPLPRGQSKGHADLELASHVPFVGTCRSHKWFQDDVYYVNLRNSEYYMAVLYGVAIAIYVASKLYRRTQGMDLNMVYGEIPAE